MFPGNIMHIYSYNSALLNVTVNVSASNEAIFFMFLFPFSLPSAPPSCSCLCVLFSFFFFLSHRLNEDIPENVSGSAALSLRFLALLSITIMSLNFRGALFSPLLIHT